MKKMAVFILMSLVLCKLLVGCLATQHSAGSALYDVRYGDNERKGAGRMEQESLVPVTGSSNSIGCPDYSQEDFEKMLEMGEYFYGFYCAGCHGRQGQGYPITGVFPRLDISQLATSDNVEISLLRMMNTDVHPNATMLFEKDALSIINYIRLTFANNPSMICPGDVVIEVNP